MKYFVALIFFSLATTFSTADETEKVNNYIDEVLSVHVPWAVQVAGLEVYQMPNFVNNFQTRNHDGTATTGKLSYHSGHLTGLQTVNRRVCSRPEWTSSNSTFYCDIIYPEITVAYEGIMQVMTSVSNNAGFRQRSFSVKGQITDMQARIEVTASPYLRIPYLKRFNVISNGKPSFRFDVLPEVPYEVMSSHFYNKYNKIFHIVIDELYIKAFDRGIASLPYPF